MHNQTTSSTTRLASLRHPIAVSEPHNGTASSMKAASATTPADSAPLVSESEDDTSSVAGRQAWSESMEQLGQHLAATSIAASAAVPVKAAPSAPLAAPVGLTPASVGAAAEPARTPALLPQPSALLPPTLVDEERKEAVPMGGPSAPVEPSTSQADAKRSSRRSSAHSSRSSSRRHSPSQAAAAQQQHPESSSSHQHPREAASATSVADTALPPAPASSGHKALSRTSSVSISAHHDGHDTHLKLSDKRCKVSGCQEFKLKGKKHLYCHYHSSFATSNPNMRRQLVLH